MEVVRDRRDYVLPSLSTKTARGLTEG